MRACLFQTALFVPMLLSSVALAVEPMGVELDPSEVRIGLMYGGAAVRVRARTPSGCDVAMSVTGASADLHLNKKGKRAGLLWMNVGELMYRDVPTVYFVRSSRPLPELASKALLDRLELGYPALSWSITGARDRDERAHFVDLIRLKERDKLFSVAEHGVALRSRGASSQVATASVFLPPKAPPGRYRVRVMCFRDRKLVGKVEATLRLSYDRNVAFLSTLSHDHGLLYGVLASLIAILAGLLTGFVFGRKGGAH